MVYDVKGKTALLTGAARGIGRATAELLASKGSNLALYDRAQEDLDKATKELQSRYPGIKVVSKSFDLVDLSNVKSMYAHALQSHGTIDIICNIAGLFDADGQFMTSDDEYDRWAKMHSLNTTSLAYSCQLATAHFRKTGKKGVIINIGSTAGIFPVAFMPIYAAGKSFVVHLSRSMANLAPQIRVNAVCPGPTKTEGFMSTLTIEEGNVGKSLGADTGYGNATLPASALADGILVAIENEALFGQTIRVTPGKGLDVYNFRAGKGMDLNALTASAKI